jgi:hypothetical protein
VPRYDAKRFEELVLYIASRTTDDLEFGRTKLAKALFYSDVESFRQLGVPITGARYVNWKHGPFPKRLRAATRLLQSAGRIEQIPPSEKYEPERLVPTVAGKPDLPGVGITPEQIEIVDAWIERIRHEPARAISDLSHQHPGYAMVGRDEEIPYESAFLAERPPTNNEVQEARRIAKERGWLVGDKWQRT